MSETCGAIGCSEAIENQCGEENHIVPVDKAPRAIVEDIVADGILAGDRLEVSCSLLHPDTDGCHVISLQGKPRQWVSNSVKSMELRVHADCITSQSCRLESRETAAALETAWLRYDTHFDEVIGRIVPVLRVVNHPSPTRAHNQDCRVANHAEVVVQDGTVPSISAQKNSIAINLVERVP